MPIQVDGQSYNYRGTIEASKGAGDSKETLSFTVYGDAAGVEHWLLQDNSKYYLLRAAADPSRAYPIETTHEEFAADKLTVLGQTKTPVRYSWVTLDHTFEDAPPPFSGTSDAMICRTPEGDRQTMMSIPLLKWQGDAYYSPSFPAADMPRSAIEAKLGLGGGQSLAISLCLFLALLFGISVPLGFLIPVKVLWWAGPAAILLRLMCARQSPVDHVLRLIAGLFFLHFCTHLLDHVFTQELSDEQGLLFESARLAVLSLVLLALRLASPKLYYSALDGSSYGGSCSWTLFTCVLIMVSMDEEDNFFQWFDWYSGMLPWSIFWLLLMGAGIWYKYRDYKHVPLDLRGFRSLLYRTTDTLNDTLEMACHKAKRLMEWADDMEDALSISADRLVASLADFKPFFEAWGSDAKKLEEIDTDALSPQEREALEADLATICADFQDLIACLDGWPATSQDLKSLRRSPRLATWGQ
jgi:hypothetical protein